jgi:hypothetical protein
MQIIARTRAPQRIAISGFSLMAASAAQQSNLNSVLLLKAQL